LTLLSKLAVFGLGGDVWTGASPRISYQIYS
jgi:hypothetical protein